MKTLKLGESLIRIDDGARWMETVYEDNTRAPATPQDTDEYRATTARLGYGADTWRQCREHEILHTWVALKMGMTHSVILWNVAHGGGKRWPTGGPEEEARVMGFQRLLNTGEADDAVTFVFDTAFRLWHLTREEITLQARFLIER